VLNDSLYNSTINKSKILNLFGLNPKRKTIIYAPSWESRKIWPIGAKKDDVNNLVKFLEFAKQNRLNVILRPHPISLIHQGVDKSYLNAMDKIKNVYLDDSTKQTLLGPNPSLFVSDVLVTDLSSIAIDFMSLGKPAVFIYPDSRVGDWSKRLPSIKEVLKVSYTVTNFADLFKLVKRLFTKREESFEIDRRKNFVSYALSVSDGNSGKLFRNELENYVKNMPLRNFISSDFVENYLRFSKKKKDINYKQTFQISFKTLKH
jgi:CDP-glycerol glycerophosphotransferase (TagB/SpsB family)